MPFVDPVLYHLSKHCQWYFKCALTPTVFIPETLMNTAHRPLLSSLSDLIVSVCQSCLCSAGPECIMVYGKLELLTPTLMLRCYFTLLYWQSVPSGCCYVAINADAANPHWFCLIFHELDQSFIKNSTNHLEVCLFQLYMPIGLMPVTVCVFINDEANFVKTDFIFSLC